MNVLEAIVNGKLAAARMIMGGIRNGDTVYINTKTGPGKNSDHVMKVTVKNYDRTTGRFDSVESEPYFGYNKGWSINDIQA